MNSVYVIIAGPSGVGKSSVAERLLARVPGTIRLITTTTRAPRPEEMDGRDYHFCSREEFANRRDRGEFLEWEENYGNLYGSSRTELDRLLAAHPIVLSIPDVRGARAMKRAFPQALTVFVAPGSIDELQVRLERRPGAKPEDTSLRLKYALTTLEQAGDFDHTVINGQGRLEAAVDEIIALIQAYQPNTP